MAVKQRVLFVAHVDAYFTGFFDLALALRRSNEFFPVVLFPRAYPNIQRHKEECLAAGIEFLSEAKSPPLRHSFFGLGFTGLALKLARGTIRRIPGIHYLLQLNALSSALCAIRRQLAAAAPNVIVLGGDIVGHDTALYIRAGHDSGIKSAILPGWMASAREPAELQLYNPAFSLERPLNRLFCRFFPQWHFHHKGRDLIRLPAQEALALETLGLAPKLPWILHSGNADVIAVESEKAREYGLREGLESARLQVVGSRTHDILYAALMDRTERRAALFARLKLDPARPLVVCALPPDMLYGIGGRPECEFTEYAELVAGFLAPIRQLLGGSFLVCPHPSADRSRLAFAADYGAIVADEPVAELLPLADLYVASISATIQWAIAAAVPVVNYDVYRYHYTDYVDLAGVITVETSESYNEALTKMIMDASFRTARMEDQLAVARHWGILDGQATVRICDVLTRLANSDSLASPQE